MSQSRILVVHNDPSALSLLLSMLKSLGHSLIAAEGERSAARTAEQGPIDLVVAGVDPADPEGLELLIYLRRKHRQTPVILLFSGHNPERAREALRLGAASVLKYPVPATDLRAAVLQELGTAAPGPTRVEGLEAEGPPGPGRRPVRVAAADLGIVGADPCVRQAVELASAIAPTRISVLIVGERGTGKTLLARAIHSRGRPEGRPFVTFNCAGRAGAVDDAASDLATLWPAKLAQAQGGTLYLDKIGALPMEFQGQLLGLLRDSLAAEHAPARSPRVIVSNDEGLAQLVALRRFRQDLFYRINGVCLNLPPLRHRGADIVRLAEFFRARGVDETGKPITGFTREAQALIEQYPWPGNVGELENMIRLALTRCAGRRIFAKNLWTGRRRFSADPTFGPTSISPAGLRPLGVALAESEKRILSESLHALRWNRQETARRLEINRTTLYKKMKKHGLLKIDDLFDLCEPAELAPNLGGRRHVEE